MSPEFHPATPEAQAAERIRRELEDRRRADETQRTALAVETALRNARVDERLSGAERHLRDINGSQNDMVTAQKEMQASLAELAVTVNTTAAVTAALRDKGVSTRTFVLAVIPIFIALLALLLSGGHL